MHTRRGYRRACLTRRRLARLSRLPSRYPADKAASALINAAHVAQVRRRSFPSYPREKVLGRRNDAGSLLRGYRHGVAAAAAPVLSDGKTFGADTLGAITYFACFLFLFCSLFFFCFLLFIRACRAFAAGKSPDFTSVNRRGRLTC